MSSTKSVEPTADQIRAEGLLRMKLALEAIERAQHELSSACAHLSTLEGAIPVWTASSKLTDKVHALWHRVNRVRNGGSFKLDGIHIDALRRRLNAHKMPPMENAQ